MIYLCEPLSLKAKFIVELLLSISYIFVCINWKVSNIYLFTFHRVVSLTGSTITIRVAQFNVLKPSWCLPEPRISLKIMCHCKCVWRVSYM